MPWSFIVPAAISLFTGNEQSNAADRASSSANAASDRAAQLQRQTAQEQLALQKRMYEEGIARQQPFYNAGVNALPELVNASKYTNFGINQFKADPGYAFRLGEGQKALERSAAARGGLLSGSTGKALQQFGQEMGSQEYTNAFNRYQTERAARLNPLQSLTGMGQTTANTLGTAGQNYAGSSANIAGNMAGNIGNAYMQQGVNQGNALLAGSQARSSAYGDIAKLYGQNYGNRLTGPDNFDPFNQIRF